MGKMALLKQLKEGCVSGILSQTDPTLHHFDYFSSVPSTVAEFVIEVFQEFLFTPHDFPAISLLAVKYEVKERM